MKILVIDDDSANRETLANVLVGLGHTVDTAVGGLQGIEKLTHEKPDLAIVDLSLRDVDGRDVIVHLCGVPAIVWTGVPLCGEEKLPGVVAAVTKPDVQELLEAVKRVADGL